MKLALANTGQGSSKTIEVSEVTFGREFNESLIHQVVVAYRAAGRQGTKQQKNRSACQGGGIKPWKQKGTGRARAGTIRSPLWRGGGMVFAQAEPRDHSQKVNRKMYRGAMRSILSELIRQSRLMVVDNFDIELPKTKTLVEKLKGLELSDVLIVVDKMDENLYLASRNIPRIAVEEARSIDPVRLLKHDRVLMTVNAIRQIEEVLA